MSYKAIARKWRPSTFEEIAGQGHVTRTLKNAIELDRIHHAFLFTGARGVGKTTAARALARALNCDQGPTATPCGECPSCLDILAGNSPDVIEIDGASNNSVEDVRDLRESVRYLPQRGRRKVYIVDEVHMLSKGAFNALLKTLEEPPDHVVFIFATTEPQKIPDTILSRVQRFDFKRIPASVVVGHLRMICDAEGIGISDDALRLIARGGEGSMRDSQSLLDQVISFGGANVNAEQVAEILGLVDRSLLYAMLEGILRGDADRCLDAIDRVYGFGYDLSEFTAEMLELLRNATLVGLSPSSQRYLDVPDDERVRLTGLAEGVAPDVFVRSFQVMLDVHEQVARAPRPRFVLEMAVARLVSIRPARPVDQIVARLGELERQLRHGGVSPRPRDTAGRRPPSPTGAQEDEEPHPGRSEAEDASEEIEAPPIPEDPGLGEGEAPPPWSDAPPWVDEVTPSSTHNSGSESRARKEVVSSPRVPSWRAGQAEPEIGKPVQRPSSQPPSSSARSTEAPLPVPSWRQEGAPSASPLARTAPSPGPGGEGAGSREGEEPREVLPPPVLPARATQDERFEALQRWWESLGPRFDTWSHDGAFGGIEGNALIAWFPTEFKLRVARNLLDHPRIEEGVSACFPGCRRADARPRPAGHAVRSRREAAEEARVALRASLDAEMRAHPLVLRLAEVLDATIEQISPMDEPPAVLAEEQR